MIKSAIKLILLIFSMFLFFMAIRSDSDDPRILLIKTQFNKFYDNCPQEKVYIQTDRNSYTVGEIIWFKAYVFFGNNNYPDTANKNLYVEIVTSDNQVYLSRLLKIKSGIGYGDFSLPDTLPQGIYFLRGYTSWMQNFDDAYLFTKKIEILNKNPQKWLTYSRLHENKHFNRSLRRHFEDLDLTFFPEGGNLVAGIESKLAFKAINHWGKGIDVEGQVFDNKKQLVSKFSSTHLGMGMLNFKPYPGKTYYAQLSKPDGTKQKFHLPPVLPQGIVMSADQDKQYLKIVVQSNLPSSNDDYSNSFFLFIQSGGKIFDISKGNVQDKKSLIQVPVSGYPDGITQLTLFNGRGEPICERLVFINNHQQLRVVTNTDKKIYGPREKVTMSIHVTNDLVHHPEKANLSLAVTANSNLQDTFKNAENILSYLLLSSDLHGKIEQPSWYFNDESEETLKALDNLLLTQGWRRFVWKNILSGKFPKTGHPIEKGITISGYVTRDIMSIPYPNSKVTLTILSTYNDVYETYTDKKGKFSFANLNYPDTISVRIEALKINGGKNLVIYVDENAPSGNTNIYSSEQKIEKMKSKQLKRQKFLYEKRRPEDEISPPIYGDADDVIYVNPNEAPLFSNVIEYLKGRVAGLNVTGDRVSIRGVSTIYGNTDPLFLVDEIQVDIGTARSIPLYDVQRIEILKGPKASFYGSSGANGVIAIYTKRGHFIIRGLSFKMLGYYSARQFYSPKYETPKDSIEPNDFRPTIYWNPSIETDKEGNATVTFYNSDAITTFSAKIEGRSSNGKVGSCEYNYNTAK